MKTKNSTLPRIRKSAQLIVLTLLISVLLAGCVQSTLSVYLSEGNGGQVTMSVLLEQSFHEMLMSGEGTFTGLEEYTQGNPVEEPDGETYIPYTFTKHYDTYEALAQGLKELGSLPVSADDLETPTADTETQDVGGLFSEVDINRTETGTGYIYTFRAVLQKQGEDTETKAEEAKAEEAKAEEAKAEEAKAEETKTEETKPEETKTDETKTDETKTDETKTDETKTDETKTDETESDDNTIVPEVEGGTVELNIPGLDALANSINSMYKMEIIVTLPTEIQQFEGGEVVDGYTLVSKISDLSVDNLIYASGENVIQVAAQENSGDTPEDTDFLGEVTPIKAKSTSSLPTALALSYLILGTCSGFYLGITHLLNNRKK